MAVSAAFGDRRRPVPINTLALILAAALTAKWFVSTPNGIPGLFKGGLWELSGPLGTVTADEVAADMWAPGSKAAVVPGRMLGGGHDLSGKLAIVTGANSGLGRETARVLVTRGCHVVMACRDEDRCREAAGDIMSMSAEDGERGGTLEVMALDLASLASVRTFAQVLLSKMEEGWGYSWQRVDFLINNAGIMALPTYETSADGYEKQFATNHLGHFFLTTLLLPRLGDGSRVVNLASVTHILAPLDVDTSQLPLKPHNYGLSLLGVPLPGYGVHAYGISKAANILFSLELRKRLAGTGVAVVSGHPGIVQTELSRNSWVADLTYTVVAPIAQALLRRKFMKTIPQGAANTLCMALHPVPMPAAGEDMTDGLYWADCEPVGSREDEPGRMFHDVVFNETKATQLWERSEALVKSAMFMTDNVPYTWDDPNKVMDQPAMDRFKATKAVEALAPPPPPPEFLGVDTAEKDHDKEL